MQQRLHDGAAVEVAHLVPEEEVRAEQTSDGDMLCETDHLRAGQDARTHQEHAHQHDHQGGQNAPAAFPEKFDVAEVPVMQRRVDQPRDQKSGDHKEHIDADEATADQRRGYVVRDDEKNSEGPETVDVASNCRVRCGHASKDVETVLDVTASVCPTGTSSGHRPWVAHPSRLLLRAPCRRAIS